MSQLQMFGMNIWFLIGLLIFLAFAGLILVAVWVALKIWLFRMQQKRAFEEYRRRTRRADGKMYPPRAGGICDQCRRVKGVVYHLPSGEKICHDCYEVWWPVAEAGKGPPTSGATAAVRSVDPAAAELRSQPAGSGGRRSTLA